MPQHRYQPLDSGQSADETLPLDTQLTILTRQSTFKQSERNVYSAEMHPDDLIQVGRRFGFADIQVYDWDTGIGAYSTVIEDRPGLHHWLYELLPAGKSRVLLVSQEDRLFRDQWETQHNRFIEQVAKHGGWVICGQRVYNFRREMDREQFRLACKYGRLYIEHHIKGRLHPAIHRIALSGRYAGGPVPWGYIVDYDKHSATYKHFVPYEPHAVLVVEQVFKRFAGMVSPSVMELARMWERERRVWPFFGPEVDERRVRILKQAAARSAGVDGYRFHFRQAQRILTDVSYLGWRVHRGEVAWDEERQAPRECHAPLVDTDLFWWCHDHIEPERPSWAPVRPSGSHMVISTYRPHQSRKASPDTIWFLAAGKLRCAAHTGRYMAVQGTDDGVRLHCSSLEKLLSDAMYTCPVVGVVEVEAALCDAFVSQLVLDDRDVRALARLAEQRHGQTGDQIAELRRQVAEQSALYERAKRRALQVEDDTVAADFLRDARIAKETLRRLERQLEEVQAHNAPTIQAWKRAEWAANVADRIRRTFADWPRHAQARVLTLALDHGVLGPVHRRMLGLYLCWHGGSESRREISRALGKHIRWTAEEEAVLRRYYDELTWDALCAMLPSRTSDAIETYASKLGIRRRRGHIERETKAPQIVRRPEITNVMAGYGFPLDGASQADSGHESSLLTSSLALRRRS
jgi:hypothetical protein